MIQKSDNISHNVANARQVKRTASGLKIAPSADLAHVGNFSVYENMHATSATSVQSATIPMKPSKTSAKAVYRNRSNFNTTGSKRDLNSNSPEKRQLHNLIVDPYSAVGREDMSIHEGSGPVAAIIMTGKIFEKEAMKRSSS